MHPTGQEEHSALLFIWFFNYSITNNLMTDLSIGLIPSPTILLTAFQSFFLYRDHIHTKPRQHYHYGL